MKSYSSRFSCHILQLICDYAPHVTIHLQAKFNNSYQLLIKDGKWHFEHMFSKEETLMGIVNFSTTCKQNMPKTQTKGEKTMYIRSNNQLQKLNLYGSKHVPINLINTIQTWMEKPFVTTKDKEKNFTSKVIFEFWSLCFLLVYLNELLQRHFFKS